MRKLWLKTFIITFLFIGFNTNWLLPGEENHNMMKKLDPLTGKWKTHSIYPANGVEALGDLKIRRILGGQWLLIEFIGQHPDRPVWEAYALIKYDSKKNHYLSYSFFNSDSPVIMTGAWIDQSTVRFETKTNGRISGIDYTVKKDGSIYQENWRFSEQKERLVVLKTIYKKK